MTSNNHQPAKPGYCDHCGGRIPRNLNRARFCSKYCQQQERNLRRRGTRVKTHRGDRPCLVCGKMMIDAAASRRYCSQKCISRANVAAERERRQARRAVSLPIVQTAERQPHEYQPEPLHPGACIRCGKKRAKIGANQICAACANRIRETERIDAIVAAAMGGGLGTLDLPRTAQGKIHAVKVG